jgi:predicted enzyme related to lactoylglutathione lyase
VFLLRELIVAGLADTPGQRAAWLTYVSTEDIEATAGQVADAGGAVLLAPTDVGARGRTALFADTAGAVFGAWQRGRFAGAQVIDEPDAVCWSEVVTRDLPAATAFYGKVFGWTERAGTSDSSHEYHEWVSTNRVVGGLSPMDATYPPETPPHWRTIMTVDDCAATVVRAGELGGRVLAGPVDAGIGQGALILDPTGGMFLVFELIPELRASMG